MVIVSIFLYSVLILTILYLLKATLYDKKVKDTAYPIIENRILKLLFLILSIVSVSIFFGIYQTNLPVAPIMPFYETITYSVIGGGIIYLIIVFIYKLILNYEPKQSISHIKAMKNMILIIVILLPVLAFAVQSNISINSESYDLEISSDNTMVTNAVSPDFTKVAMLVTKSNSDSSVYLAVEDLVHNQASIYKVCNLLHESNFYCLSDLINLVFYNNSLLVLYIQREDPINNNPTYSYPIYGYSFNLNTKKFSQQFNFSDLWSLTNGEFKTLRLNSKLFFCSYFQVHSELEVAITDPIVNKTYSILTNMTADLQGNNNTKIFLGDYMISSDLSKLALSFTISSTTGGKSYSKTNFYKIGKLIPNITSNTTFVSSDSSGSATQFFQIANDFNNFYYELNSYITTTTTIRTSIDYFNFTSNKSSNLFILYSSFPFSILNLEKSFFIIVSTDSPNYGTSIYSFHNNQTKLTQNTPLMTLFTDSTGDRLLSVVSKDNSTLFNKIELLGYTASTKSLKNEQVVFSNHVQTYDLIFNIIPYIFIAIEAIMISSEIVSVFWYYNYIP